jgi:ABC-type glycerol-3-phosphate transport system substrate-binding protein
MLHVPHAASQFPAASELPAGIGLPAASGPALNRLSAWWVGALVVLLTMVVGCDRSNQPVDEQTVEVPTSTVPLRVVSAASEGLNRRIEMAWRAVSDQPIEIIATTNGNAQTEEGGTALSDAAPRADVIIFQNQSMGDLQADGALVPLPDVVLQSDAVDTESLLPALVGDLLTWGDQVYAIPLGSVRPALWHDAEMDVPDSIDWDQYADLVRQTEAGKAAEPLADGWAAVSFLWRAVTLTRETWLFDRQTFQPVIDSPPYVLALEQLVEASQSYPSQPMSPDEIWVGLQQGSLRIALAWPEIPGNTDPLQDSGAEQSLAMVPYPSASQVYLDGWNPSDGRTDSILLAPTGLSVGIAASCRQTAASRSFLTWLVSREGHGSLRGGTWGLGPNRVQIDSDATPTSNLGLIKTDQERAGFDAYLIQSLSTTAVRPTVRIPNASQYMEELDKRVLAAIAGDLTPQEALTETARAWDAITQRVGRRKQTNAWRQAQGMRRR